MAKGKKWTKSYAKAYKKRWVRENQNLRRSVGMRRRKFGGRYIWGTTA